MRYFAFVFAAVLLVAGCNRGAGDQPDHHAEWRDVLRHKQAAASPDAPPQVRQVYADSVAAFLQKHPNHGRAREVWQRIQLEFADDLSAMGRYQDSIRFYRAVLAHDPANEQAQRGLNASADRLAVTRDKLLLLEKGMSKREVAGILGRPIPGWTERKERRETTVEAWYYRTRTGGIAGVYFRDGRVFAAEESSHARVSRLGS